MATSLVCHLPQRRIIAAIPVGIELRAKLCNPHLVYFVILCRDGIFSWAAARMHHTTITGIFPLRRAARIATGATPPDPPQRSELTLA
ncbi:hypothetical protein [Actibacterium ureilyticum]|uniref:hypothetical protein n=1 Tax=Actibacterium ureilyticum TaxID=1590614 RepID=UPI001140E0CA|nr:hypothetical protein [Actibacterium ureilyticum]